MVDRRSIGREAPPNGAVVKASKLDRYSVAPLPPQLPPEPVHVLAPQEEKEWFLIPILGWMPAVILIPIVWAMIGSSMSCGIAFAILGASFLMTAIYFVNYYATRSAAAQEQLDDKRRENWDRHSSDVRASALREGADTTVEMRSTLVASAALFNGLFAALERATDALELASAEYQTRAIPPFWDAIESAAAALGAYDDCLTRLLDNARTYYDTLTGRCHTFPPFPYVSSDLPSESDMVTRFKQVVRMGHTDDKFAGIWEQRKTTEAIKTGFGSLERAVRQVGANITGALSDVQMTLDAGFDRVVESQLSSTAAVRSTLDGVAQSADLQRRELAAILRSQDSKLDNIQWRRKPLGSKYLRQ